MRHSLELREILRAANDMAEGAGQSLTTGHLLLGMMTSANRAGAVLTDLRIDAPRVIEALGLIKQMDGHLEESDALLEAAYDRMLTTARGNKLVSSLHLLLALTRQKTSIAFRAFGSMGVHPVQVRTMALGRLTGPPPRAVGRQPMPAADRAFDGEPTGSVTTAAPPAAPSPRAQPQRRSGARPAGPKARQRPAVTGAIHDPAHPSGEPAARRPSGRATPAPLPPPTRSSPSSKPLPTREVGDFSDPNADDADSDEPTDPGARFLLDPQDFPVLTSLGRNLSAEAARGEIDRVIGRDRIIDTMIDVLNKRRSNNPCLVGEPGVGKTAIVEGLAQAIEAHGERLAALHDRIIISLDVGSLVAGTELRGSFSRRMAKLKEEVRESDGRVIVFIDEIHTLVGAGSGDGALDAANDLKAALARGDFPCIGATTSREYDQHIGKDPALERRFQPIEVDEPSEEEALEILQGIIEKYEDHHGVLYRPESLEAAVRMSRRYIVDRRLPDKAFNLADTAAARAVRRGKEVVEVIDVAEVVAELTQIPIARLMMTDAERVLNLRAFMSERVIGHGDVLDAVTEVIQRNSAGFSSNRPIGSFLFLGPSGVGKTETAKVLADFLFCSKDAMTRFDMSEFMERHTISRLLGAAPGYVGHEESGQLTAALSRRPYQIILFDEVEKAHPDVLNIMLQMLDEGQVTDAKGHTLSFANTVIIMTSNLGADILNSRLRKPMGFGEGAATGRLAPKDLDASRRKAKKALPPELWGRIDEKCVFAPLGREEIAEIARLLIAESSERLAAEKNIRYEASPEALAFVIDHDGFDPSLGARPMRRAIQRWLETTVARAILRGDAAEGDRLRVELEDGTLVVKTETNA